MQGRGTFSPGREERERRMQEKRRGRRGWGWERNTKRAKDVI
jgi:hypothetical protein